MIKLKWISGHLVAFCDYCRQSEKMVAAAPEIEMVSLDVRIPSEMGVRLGVQFDAFVRKHTVCYAPVITRIGEKETFK